MTLPSIHAALAQRVADLFIKLPQVEAIALGGSWLGGAADDLSDIDVYVYTTSDVPIETRREIVEMLGGATRASMHMTFWGYDDMWLDADTGIEVDIVYFDKTWIEEQLERVLTQHQPSGGYTTSFWYTVRNSRILQDPSGWFAKLRTWSKQDYPEALRRNIIRFNHPVLRNLMPSYLNQLARSVQRRDFVSINHRVAGFLASYFDVLFALNRVLHPGEKRLLTFALGRCERLPDNMEAEVKAVLHASGTVDPALIHHLDTLMDHLDELLAREGFDPNAARPERVEGKA